MLTTEGGNHKACSTSIVAAWLKQARGRKRRVTGKTTRVTLLVQLQTEQINLSPPWLRSSHAPLSHVVFFSISLLWLLLGGIITVKHSFKKTWRLQITSQFETIPPATLPAKYIVKPCFSTPVSACLIVLCSLYLERRMPRDPASGFISQVASVSQGCIILSISRVIFFSPPRRDAVLLSCYRSTTAYK